MYFVQNYQMMMPVPVVGAVAGLCILSPAVAVGTWVGGRASGMIGGKLSTAIYDKNMETKCPLCLSDKKQPTVMEGLATVKAEGLKEIGKLGVSGANWNRF